MPGPDPTQYEAFADGYDLHAADSAYNAMYDRPATLALLGEVAGRRVLDAACGPGHYLAELVARGADPIGCDASPRMIELARARVGPDVELHVQSLDDPLPWIADGSVDVVLCALALHYVTDRVGFLREARRVLRPGGSVVISTHHPTDDWRRLGGSYFDTGTVTETWSKGWTVTAWRMPLSQLTDEFAEAGFVIERLAEPRPLPEMEASHPASYGDLLTVPAFVLFKLRPA